MEDKRNLAPVTSESTRGETGTVYVIDDDPSIRRLLTWLVEREKLPVMAYAAAEPFLASYRGGPGCLVLDLALTGMDGLTLQKNMAERGIDLPILFVSGTADVSRAVEAVKRGAMDFVVKPFDYVKMAAAIRACFTRGMEVHAAKERAAQSQASFGSLTAREREVLDRVVAGKLNRVIAEELEVSIKTVEAHRAKLMEKLRVGSVAELVRVALAGAPPPRL